MQMRRSILSNHESKPKLGYHACQLRCAVQGSPWAQLAQPPGQTLQMATSLGSNSRSPLLAQSMAVSPSSTLGSLNSHCIQLGYHASQLRCAVRGAGFPLGAASTAPRPHATMLVRTTFSNVSWPQLEIKKSAQTVQS